MTVPAAQRQGRSSLHRLCTQPAKHSPCFLDALPRRSDRFRHWSGRPLSRHGVERIAPLCAGLSPAGKLDGGIGFGRSPRLFQLRRTRNRPGSDGWLAGWRAAPSGSAMGWGIPAACIHVVSRGGHERRSGWKPRTISPASRQALCGGLPRLRKAMVDGPGLEGLVPLQNRPGRRAWRPNASGPQPTKWVHPGESPAFGRPSSCVKGE